MASQPIGSEIVICPYESVGPIAFDMTTADVEAALGLARYVNEHPGHGQRWFYGEPGLRLRVIFDDDGRVEGVDVLDHSAVVDGIPLAGQYSDVTAALQARGHAPRVEVEGKTRTGAVFFDDIGVLVWSDDPDNPTIEQSGGYRKNANNVLPV